MYPKINIAGTYISNISMDETVRFIHEGLIRRDLISVFTPNVDFVVKAKKTVLFQDTLNNANLLIPDGKPLIWASKFLGDPLKEKVSGSSLFFRLCELADKNNYRIFLLGAAEGVAEIAKKRLEQHYPGLIISGTYSPKLQNGSDSSEIEKINKLLKESCSDILVVGMGAPKQEYFIAQNMKNYNIPISLGLGGTIDFAAGIQKMPSEGLKKSGLAWLYRLIINPKRLWRRYLLEDPIFFWYILLQRFGLLG